jgi:hypothetical protein
MRWPHDTQSKILPDLLRLFVHSPIDDLRVRRGRRLDKTLGTVEFDKEADILVVRGNPLENLRGLMDVERVIHGGAIIR